MKALLIGSRAMLGRAFVEALQADGHACVTADRPGFDLSVRESMSQVTSDFDVVICCAAWTDVDGAEADEAGATAVNGTGVRWLAERCGTVNVPLIHFSTDYVFAGDATTPYPVDCPRAPLNAYGRSKALGEEGIEASGAEYLIVRTSWLYAPWGQNFVRTMARLTAERDALKVVDDQRGRPTSAQRLASTTLAMFTNGARGIHHVTDGGECTWRDLAAHVAERLGTGCEVAGCTTAEFPRPAPRPSYSVLDLSATEAIVGPMGAWQEHVDAALAEREPAA